MKMTKEGLDLIKSFEGYHTELHNGDCQAYWDSLGRVWTIGWGCTEGVEEGDIWSRKKAEARFALEVEKKHGKYVRDLAKKYNADLDDNQYSALVSFSYNLGARNAEKIIKLWPNEEKMAAKMLSYDHAGRPLRKVKGLTRRREAEVALFKKYTPKQVVESSAHLTVMDRVDKLTTYVGVPAFGATMATLDKVKEYLMDYKLLTAGLLILSVIGITKYVKYKGVEAHYAGRYTGSKE